MAFDLHELQARLRSLGVKEECPACGRKGDPDVTLVAPAGLDDNIQPIANAIYPMAATVCGHCAHIRFFSLRHLGF